MNDQDLNRILKSAPVPERSEPYWEQFPRRVLARLRRPPQPRADRLRSFLSQSSAGAMPGFWRALAGDLLHQPALGLGLLALCVALGFGIGFWRGRQTTATERLQLAEAEKCFREVAALFPNQLQALVFDEQGPRLVLSDKPTVPASPPIYVKISGPRGCERVVTFSGQQIRMDGEIFDVLVDRQGTVIVVGAQWAWSSSAPAAKSGRYRIEARPLPLTS